MTLLVGYHFQEDSYTGPPMDAATFLDVGGIHAAEQAAERMCRVYFTGRPDPAWVAGKLAEPPAAGLRNVVANEPNLASENFGGGPADYAAWFCAVVDRAPAGSRLYYAGMSPGVPGWEAWYTDPAARTAIDRAAGLCVHTYGDLAELERIVSWIVAAFPGKPVWIGEFNWGAGRDIGDVDAWAHANIPPFLDWLNAIPQVEAACWFSWFWDLSAGLPTPVDAKGTQVETVLREWVPPAGGGGGDVATWYPGAVQRPIAHNYTPGRGGLAPAVLVDHVAEGLGSCFGWFNTDRGAAGSSAHFWVSRGGAVEQYRPLEDTCWANGIVNQPDTSNPSVAAIVASGVDPNRVSAAIEHEGYSGDQFPDAQVAASRALHQWLGSTLKIPLNRERVLGHYQFDSVTRANCPGATFPYARVLDPPPFDVAAVRDQVWALANTLELNGWPWYGQSLKAATAASKGEQ